MSKNESNLSLSELKQSLIDDLDNRVADRILEPANRDLLKKLINNAENKTEAISIAELGTTYKRTGFHFDKKLEKLTDTIKYFKKNTELSFVTDSNKLTHKLIIGDNYDALLNLSISYKNKIDVIYIDPPYGKDDMGEFAHTNYDNAISRDNLLSMLYPRLVLARELLTDEGVIFCSIDDKNQAYVKGLFDEVFGEQSFVTSIHCQLSTTQGMKVKAAQNGNIVKNGEYITVYSKDGHQNIAREYLLYDLRPEYDEHYTLTLKDDGTIGQLKELYDYSFPKDCKNSKPYSIAEAYKRSEEFAEIVRSHLAEIVRSDKVTGFDISEDLRYGYWTKVERENKNYILTLDSKGNVKQLLRLVDSWGKCDDYYNSEGLRKIRGNWWNDFYIDMGNVSKEGGVELKNGKKPVRLLKQLIQMCCPKDGIVLDFFAGSGTTGHAVLELNKEDGGNRTFILCTNNEVTKSNPNGIAYDVTSKRLKRVMTGECYDGSKDFKWNKDHQPLGDNLDVYEIEQVSNINQTPGECAFDVIDETLYGIDKLEPKEKIRFVCENFSVTQKTIEE